MTPDSHTDRERLVALETASITTLESLREVRAGLEALRVSIDRLANTKSSWGAWASVIIGVVGLFFALWASTIRPLEVELARRGPVIEALQESSTRQREQITGLNVTLTRVEREGSPITRERLTVLENQMRNVLQHGGGVSNAR